MNSSLRPCPGEPEICQRHVLKVPSGREAMGTGLLGFYGLKAGVALLFTAVLLGAGTAFAERFLTMAETLKLCFPRADRFEEKKIHLAPEQLKAVGQKAGSKATNPALRLWFARLGTNVVGTLVFDQVIGKHEMLDYAVAISPEGKVMQIEILEYREHYGGQVRSPKWREQFQGKTADAPLKLNDDIYNISGATMSCRHVTEGVRRVLATYELVVRPRLLAVGELPDSGAAPKP